jgi:biotin synthase
MESPEYVQTSLAAAITLGLEPGRFARNVRLRGLNLLLTYERGCAASCTYCGLAKDRNADDSARTFIRVKWPTYPLEKVMQRVNGAEHAMERVCASMVAHRKALEDSLTIIERFRRETDLSISALVTPTSIKGPAEIEMLRQAGADMMSVAVDAATRYLFDSHRGNSRLLSWDHYWQTLRDGVAVFGPGKVGIHLVVGLGETEKEMIETIQSAHDLGVGTHLFSFFPELGSRLADFPQPPIGQYRRVQMARYVINDGLGNAAEMKFNAAGQVEDFGIGISELLDRGEAFTTSGCGGKSCRVACNRPFGNERPSRPFRNFPLDLETEDTALVKSQLWEGLR